MHLPEFETTVAMRDYLRPFTFRIKPADKGTKIADVGIHLMSSWCVDGIGVLVRNGAVVEVGPVDLVHPIRVRGAAFEHPVFGTLSRIPDDDPWEVIDQWKPPRAPKTSGFEGVKRGGPWPWEGLTRCDAFREFAMVADDRAEFIHNRARADAPRSRVNWNLANGEFILRVYAAAGEEPTDAQAAATAAFRKVERIQVAAMLAEIYAQYQETCEIRRKNWIDGHVDDVIPRITSPEGLRDLIQLVHVHVHPEDKDGRVTIAFQFVCTFDYDGFTALWRDAKSASGERGITQLRLNNVEPPPTTP
jgi:hypothetical protein